MHFLTKHGRLFAYIKFSDFDKTIDKGYDFNSIDLKFWGFKKVVNLMFESAC